MQKLKITGGRTLNGEVKVSGAKNAALPILAASLMTKDPLVLSNVPELSDVRTMVSLLGAMGVRTQKSDNGISLSADSVTTTQAPYELVKTMRASIVTLGPLLARFGEARVSLPGGCSIGSRPVDQHIKGLQAMGADIRIENGYVVAKAKRLKGCVFATDMVTVTGTENLLMAAALADGVTVLENAAQEPEVVDLADCLIGMGAKISGAGTSRITVEGVESLHGNTHSILPDRIEAGTFLVAAAAAGGDVVLRGADPSSMEVVLSKLIEAGARLDVEGSLLRVRMNGRPRPVNIRTMPHPGFPTDMQAQFMALDAVADGASSITETIFENRFMHVPELRRMGADIVTEGHTASVTGVRRLSGADVMATDLRASASLVIAGLVADGTTVVDRIYHLDRGYDHMERKLAALGADIVRIG